MGIDYFIVYNPDEEIDNAFIGIYNNEKDAVKACMMSGDSLRYIKAPLNPAIEISKTICAECSIHNGKLDILNFSVSNNISNNKLIRANVSIVNPKIDNNGIIRFYTYITDAVEIANKYTDNYDIYIKRIVYDYITRNMGGTLLCQSLSKEPI